MLVVGGKGSWKAGNTREIVNLSKEGEIVVIYPGEITIICLNLLQNILFEGRNTSHREADMCIVILH